MRRILTGEEIASGETLPKGWGVSYRMIHRHAVVAHPIPFNYLVGWCLRLYDSLRRGPRPSDLREIERTLFQIWRYADETRKIFDLMFEKALEKKGKPWGGSTGKPL